MFKKLFLCLILIPTILEANQLYRNIQMKSGIPIHYYEKEGFPIDNDAVKKILGIIDDFAYYAIKGKLNNLEGLMGKNEIKNFKRGIREDGIKTYRKELQEYYQKIKIISLSVMEKKKNQYFINFDCHFTEENIDRYKCIITITKEKVYLDTDTSD